MPALGTYNPTPSSIPIPVARKAQVSTVVALPQQMKTHARVPLPPPSVGSSVNTSAVPSLTSASYAKSQSSGDVSSAPGHGVDLMEMMNDRIGAAVNPIPMDRSLAKQAQTSGELNAKQQELLELQALAQRRLRGTRANLADGIKAAKEVRKDLEWTQKRVSGLKATAARKQPAAYAAARERYPSPDY